MNELSKTYKIVIQMLEETSLNPRKKKRLKDLEKNNKKKIRIVNVNERGERWLTTDELRRASSTISLKLNKSFKSLTAFLKKKDLFTNNNKLFKDKDKETKQYVVKPQPEIENPKPNFESFKFSTASTLGSKSAPISGSTPPQVETFLAQPTVTQPKVIFGPFTHNYSEESNNDSDDNDDGYNKKQKYSKSQKNELRSCLKSEKLIEEITRGTIKNKGIKRSNAPKRL
jgi:hypothetical protein